MQQNPVLLCLTVIRQLWRAKSILDTQTSKVLARSLFHRWQLSEDRSFWISGQWCSLNRSNNTLWLTWLGTLALMAYLPTAKRGHTMRTHTRKIQITMYCVAPDLPFSMLVMQYIRCYGKYSETKQLVTLIMQECYLCTHPLLQFHFRVFWEERSSVQKTLIEVYNHLLFQTSSGCPQ